MAFNLEAMPKKSNLNKVQTVRNKILYTTSTLYF